MIEVTRRLFLEGAVAAVAAISLDIPASEAKQVGLIYGERSKLLRRAIVPDDPRELLDPLHLGKGEAMLAVWTNVPPLDTPTMQAIVARHCGVDPAALPSGRCAVVDASGDVVRVIMADPQIDAVEGMQLVLNDDVAAGWRYEDGAFLARYVEADQSGIVERVFWDKPGRAPRAGICPHLEAAPGELVAHLRRTEAPSAGTRRL